MEIIAGIVFFLAGLWVNLYFDYKSWLKKEVINHTQRWFRKLIFTAPSIVIFTLYSWGWGIVVLPFMLMSWYWMLFDGFYNIARGYDWWFTGSEDGKDDAKSDNFLQGLTLKEHILVKSLAIVVTTVLFFVI